MDDEIGGGEDVERFSPLQGMFISQIIIHTMYRSGFHIDCSVDPISIRHRFYSTSHFIREKIWRRLLSSWTSSP